jgi:formamidopyrimidine-DNA glycosylase
MPEIAEVERARTILDQILKDQSIIDVEAVHLEYIIPNKV